MDLIPPPYEEGHQCGPHLPDAARWSDGYLARCRQCYRWYVRYTDYTYWADPRWRPVHWWNFILRRRIRTYS